jgi:hypothetical protein
MPQRASRYNDFVDASDYSNREWFVFHLGAFGNKPIYCIGEANDINSIELALRRTVPVYKRLISVPIQESKRYRDKMQAMIMLGTMRQVDPTHFLSASLGESLQSQDTVFVEYDHLIQDILESCAVQKL